MLWEYRLPIPAELADRVEEECEEPGAWFLFRDALAKDDYLMGYFECRADAARDLERIGEALGESFSLDRASEKRVEDRDWKEAYKDHFTPWSFQGLHWVPAWKRETFSVPDGERAIWMDPGMAFGTGNHETTRMCVERMMAFRDEVLADGRDPGGLSVLDAGSGSGILALSAARVGFGEVSGFDNDAEAVAVSRRNAAENDLFEQVTFSVAGLPDGLDGRRADLLLANIQSDVLCGVAEALLGAVNPRGLLAMSGILADEVDSVRHVFRTLGRQVRTDIRTMGEWADLTVRRVDA